MLWKSLLLFLVIEIEYLSPAQSSRLKMSSSNSFNQFLSSSTVIVAITFAHPFLSAQAVPYDAYNYLNKGVASFRDLHVKESISWFDKAEQAYPEIGNRLWQRGIAQYLNGDYNKCYSQFTRDISLNAKDTEEAVWSIMCAYKQDSLTDSLSPDDVVTKHKALIPKALQLIAKESRTDQDSRPIMRQVYSLFTDAASASLLAQSGNDDDIRSSSSKSTASVNINANVLESISAQQSSSPEGTFSSSAYFYANLYLSLYNDMIGDSTGVKKYVEKALQTQYASSSNDYMISVAKALQQQQLQ
jgi:tetratricopeptide (TPR) repeat protein